jgi:hypothetical protein
VMEEWERKAHARARRANAAADPFDTRTRWVPPAGQYRRGFKHPPRTVEEWDSLD